MSESDSKTGAGAPAFPFSAQDAMEFMQKMWNPLGLPLPGFGAQATPTAAGAAPAAPMPMFGGMPFPNPATMFAALDPNEVERKIAELRVIESWLAMSLGMMQMSIKTLELQKASLEALRGTAKPAAEAPPHAHPRSRKG